MYCTNPTNWCVYSAWDALTSRCLIVQSGEEFIMRVVYDVSFWAILTLTVVNLVFGVIIDTFGDLRAERQAEEERLNNSCFICALEREK